MSAPLPHDGSDSPTSSSRKSSRANTDSNIGTAETNSTEKENWLIKVDNEEAFIAHDEMIKKFVITGGPCSGKTTAMARLKEFLSEKGFRVFVAIEAATVLWTNGVSPADLAKPECEEAFQQFVLNFQMTVEDNLFKFAKASGQKSVILCDRGLMDGSAYVTSKQWESVLSKCKVPQNITGHDGSDRVEMVGLNNITARDQRYDAVFHLVTAADGAPQYYTLENNKGARHETPEMARAQDMKTQTAWAGHPHHIIIDNSNNKNFEAKMEELVGLISSKCGMPALMRKSRKFKLKDNIAAPQLVDDENGSYYRIRGIPGTPDIDDVHIFEIEKIFLSVEKFTDSMSLTRSNSQVLSRSSSLQGVNNGEVSPVTPSQLSQTEALPGKITKVFIRKRTQNSLHSYGLTTVKVLPKNAEGLEEEIELKDVINEKYYKLLQKFKDPNHATIKERRLQFIYHRQSFVIHEITRPQKSTYIECQANADEPDLPPCLDINEKTDEIADTSISLRLSKKDFESTFPFSPLSSSSPQTSPFVNGDGQDVQVSGLASFVGGRSFVQPNFSGESLNVTAAGNNTLSESVDLKGSLANCYFGNWTSCIHTTSKLGELNVSAENIKSFTDILTVDMNNAFNQNLFEMDQNSISDASVVYSFSSQSEDFKEHLRMLSNEAIRQFRDIFSFPFESISAAAGEEEIYIDVDSNGAPAAGGGGDGFSGGSATISKKQDPAMEALLLERSYKLFLDFFKKAIPSK